MLFCVSDIKDHRELYFHFQLHIFKLCISAKTGTTTVNVVPIPAGSMLNTVNTPTGVKMIVVSSGMGAGNQTFHIITTTATAGVQTSTTSSPITLQLPSSITSTGKPATLTLAAKSLPGGAAALLNAGGGTAQLLSVPAQGMLSAGPQTFTIGGKPVTVAMTTPQGITKTVTLVSSQSSVPTTASLINTVTTTLAGKHKYFFYLDTKIISGSLKFLAYKNKKINKAISVALKG